MKCPFCGSEETQVKDSRPAEDNATIRRRRACSECEGRFTTFERVQLRELAVIKGDGTREPFDRDKLAKSMAIALQKRPVSSDNVERAVNSIVRQLEATGDSDIPTSKIGEYVMENLARLDQVAYIRYASVYRNFHEAEDFNEFLGDMTKQAESA